jgi:hypothetical protein
MRAAISEILRKPYRYLNKKASLAARIEFVKLRAQIWFESTVTKMFDVTEYGGMNYVFAPPVSETFTPPFILPAETRI